MSIECTFSHLITLTDWCYGVRDLCVLNFNRPTTDTTRTTSTTNTTTISSTNITTNTHTHLYISVSVSFNLRSHNRWLLSSFHHSICD
jgi:hypothetical protein